MKKRSPEDTRLALIRAAEVLFAERGFDAVSLREVSVAAGQANNSAVGYHFGNREGLVDAILARHSWPIQDRYVAQIEALERHGELSVRALVEIMALPIIQKLDDADGGWAYLSLCAQLVVSPHLPLVSRAVAQSPQVMRLMQAFWPYVNVPPEISAFRLERIACMMYVGIAQWHRLSSTGSAHVERKVFESELIDALVDVIERPASPQTLKALGAEAPLAASAPKRRAAKEKPTPPRRSASAGTRRS